MADHARASATRAARTLPNGTAPRSTPGTVRHVSHDNPAPDIPDWATHVTPDTLDPRVLDQADIWVTRDATVLRITAMSTDHIHNVLTMLTERASELRLSSLLDATYQLMNTDTRTVDDAEQLAWDLVRTYADLTPPHWLETTALVIALRTELATRPTP